MYSPYPMKNNSIKSILKNIASWTYIPFIDAYSKAFKMTDQPNGFEILILFFLNLVNRFGSFIQKNFNN